MMKGKVFTGPYLENLPFVSWNLNSSLRRFIIQLFNQLCETRESTLSFIESLFTMIIRFVPRKAL